MNKDIDINRSNYENYVIDYLDGKLTAVETACFIVFLGNNPDINEEIAELNKITIEPDDYSFTEKSRLKKKVVISVGNINEDNYEEFFIADHEGDLIDSQKELLRQFLEKNPSLHPEHKLFGDVKLEPDTGIVFTDKNLLKRKSIIIPVWYSAAAAIIILFAAYWFLFNQQSPDIRKEITYVNEIPLKANTFSLSKVVSTEIEMDQRQISVVKFTDDTPEIADHEKIILAHIESKNINEQLVDTYDYARLVEKQKNIPTATPEESETSLASVEQTNKAQDKGLLAKVFSNQVSKIAQRFKINRNNREKSTDPTYIKVIDRSLLVFNTITGSETSTMKIYNKNGELTSYQVEGQEVLLSRNFSNKSSQ